MNLIYLFTRVCSSSETVPRLTIKIPRFLFAFSSPFSIPFVFFCLFFFCFYVFVVAFILPPCYSLYLFILICLPVLSHLGYFRLFSPVYRCTVISIFSYSRLFTHYPLFNMCSYIYVLDFPSYS